MPSLVSAPFTSTRDTSARPSHSRAPTKLVVFVRTVWLTLLPDAYSSPFLSQVLVPKEHLAAQTPFTSA